MTLKRLSDVIMPTRVDDFAAKIFGNSPRYFSGPDRFADITFGIEEFEELLWCHEHVLPHHLAVYNASREIDLPRRPLSKDLFRWAIDQHLERHTLRFENAHKVLPWAAALAGDSANHLLSHVSIDVLLMSGPGQFGAHGLTSEPDLLVVQTYGDSIWQLKEMPALPCKNVELGAVQTCANRLKPGDAFYIPAGHFSSAKSDAPYSICVVLQISPFTTADLLDSLIEVTTECDPQHRLSLPQNSGALAISYSRAIRTLSAATSSIEMRALARKRLQLWIADQHRPIPGGHLSGVHDFEKLSEESLVEIRPGTIFSLSAIDSGLYLYVPGLGGVSERESRPGGLIFPHAAGPLLEAIISFSSPFTVDDLPKVFTKRARLATIRRLVKEGALRAVSITGCDDKRRSM